MDKREPGENHHLMVKLVESCRLACQAVAKACPPCHFPRDLPANDAVEKNGPQNEPPRKSPRGMQERRAESADAAGAQEPRAKLGVQARFLARLFLARNRIVDHVAVEPSDRRLAQ